MVNDMKKKTFINSLVLLSCVVFLSVGFSAWQNKLCIENMIVDVRIDKDIRVTNFLVEELSNASSLNEDYNTNRVSSDYKLNNKDSYIIYEVSVSNLGNVPMAISKFLIDNDNLKAELLDYNLKEKICDKDLCYGGVEKKIKVKVSLKDSVNVSSLEGHFSIEVLFAQVYTVTYLNIPNSDSFPKEVVENDTLKVVIPSSDTNFLKVFMNNKSLIKNEGFQLENKTLILPNVSGDVRVFFKMPTCQRATVLHQEECTGRYCKSLGYSLDGSKKTKMITYGSLGVEKTLSTGDAFDCDVNGDGLFDSDTERFYYVNDLKDSEYALLIYYSNVCEGKPCKNKTFAYDEVNENWHGPRVAIKQLPTTSLWGNITLSNSFRAIENEYGTNKNNAGNVFPSAFSYEGYAARLLTFQELKNTIDTYIPTWKSGELNKYLFFVEKTSFADGNTSTFDGYWLESARFGLPKYAWFVWGAERRVHSAEVINNSTFGVRPVIEISKSEISY